MIIYFINFSKPTPTSKRTFQQKVYCKYSKEDSEQFRRPVGSASSSINLADMI